MAFSLNIILLRSMLLATDVYSLWLLVAFHGTDVPHAMGLRNGPELPFQGLRFIPTWGTKILQGRAKKKEITHTEDIWVDSCLWLL